MYSSLETKRDYLKSLVYNYTYNTIQSSIDWGQLATQFGDHVYTRNHSTRNHSTLNHSTGDISYYWSSNNSLDGIKAVYSYFNEYPLQSSKHNDFLIWREALCVILERKHTTEYGRNLCIQLRDRLKASRT